MNIALLLGAFTAALMSMQFAIRRAPKSEYVYGAVGGSLMGIGAKLARGCTSGQALTGGSLLNSKSIRWNGITLPWCMGTFRIDMARLTGQSGDTRLIARG